ncbi:MAG: ArsC/Spx/MgsR family protein [Candidatus Paceibacteria bacterium]
MTKKVVVYYKPTCNTCRRVLKALKNKRVAFDTVNYYKTPFSAKKLKMLLKELKLKPDDLLRKNEPIYKKLGLEKKKLQDDKLIELMIKYPDLVQRPIVEYGRKALLARPPEKLKEIF